MFKTIDFSPYLLEAVLEIEKMSFKYPWNKEQILSCIENRSIIFKVALEDDIVIGYIIFLVARKESELLKIAIAPKFRHKGYGRLLIESFIKYAKDIEQIFLEVRASNKEAVNLYESLDFKKINVRKNYYGDEDALILRKTLC